MKTHIAIALVAAGLALELVAAPAVAAAAASQAGSRATIRAVEAANAPLPTCAVKDLPAPHASYASYPTTLLDTAFKLPRNYVPHDLVSTGLSGGGLIRKVALADLKAMDRAARAAGARFGVTSAYRSYALQVITYRIYGPRIAARPGHSEHQLGTAIDFRSYGGGGSFGSTRAGRWMAANAYKFGWVMSYPASKTALTCYGSEPWHFRYVGRVEARAIHDGRTTTRQWIWANFGG